MESPSSRRGGPPRHRPKRAARPAALLAFVMVIAACRGGPDLAEIDSALSWRLAVDSAPDWTTPRHWRNLRAIYAANDRRPIWLDGARPTDRARGLADAVCAAERQGLHPGAYRLAGLVHAAAAAFDSSEVEASALADVDLRLTALFLEYGSHLLAGRLAPQEADSGWYLHQRRTTIDAALRAAIRAPTFARMVAPLVPTHQEYLDLAKALDRYRAMARAGRWTPLPGGRLAPGRRGPAVAALRRRLTLLGDFTGDTTQPAVYDAGLRAAVARFDARHGLPADSAVDRETRAALAVPLEDRIAQMELNLERMRWMPSSFGERYVLVNIPDFELLAVEDRRMRLRMRVIVGEEYEGRTPVFADSMSFVVFRPYWNVPASIVKKEMIPRLREDAGFLEAGGYELVEDYADTVVVDPATVDWAEVDTADFDLEVRQRPGPGNALGLIKFMFPNRFNIYLHDTPADYLFDARNRSFSHGCVRVEEPVRLAQWLFEGDSEWDAERIRAAMTATGDTAINRVVSLERRVPVFIVYLTAFTRNGAVHFRDDVYGVDREVRDRLEAAAGDSAAAERCAELRRALGG